VAGVGSAYDGGVSDEDRERLRIAKPSSRRQYEGGEIDDQSRNNNSHFKRDGSRNGGKSAITMAHKIASVDQYKVKSGTGGTTGKDSAAAQQMMNPNASSIKKSQVYN
tara:strand:- start:21 stop:344 length:324 start_codon:yes stop_codon:yes gene_type:complete